MGHESYEVASKNINVNTDKVPLATCVIQFINKQALKKPILVLFDSGSSSTWISASALPKGCVPKKCDEIKSTTLAGTMKSNQEVSLDRIVFPEFFKTRVVDTIQARVFHAPCRYDCIIGRDLLTDIGMTLDFKNLKMSWDECHVPMREFSSLIKPRKNDGFFKGPEPTVAEQLYYDALEEDLEDDDTLPTCDSTDCSEDDYFLNDDDEFDQGNDHACYRLRYRRRRHRH